VRDVSRVAFVEAGWHWQVVERCRMSFVREMQALGHADTPIDFFETPGSLEIPLQAKRLATSRRYAVIVAAGLIVDGGIYRHEFVAATVIDALMRVQLDTDVPILSAVLTPQSFHEHKEHLDFFLAHFEVKGVEIARACAWALRATRIPAPGARASPVAT